MILLPLAFAGPHAVDAARHVSAPQASLSARRALPSPPPGTVRRTVYGYAPYWEDALDQEWDKLTHIAIFSAGIDDSGNLESTSNWTSVAPDILPVAREHGVRVHLCLTSFYDSQHAGLLPNASRRAALIEALAEEVESLGVDGINVDFEGLDADLNEEFATFIEELSDRVEDVWIATPAVDWSGAFDYARLAAASEGLFIMGYGYSWSGSDPGPNDPLYASSRWGNYALDWTVADYLASGAPADKIVLGLPLYGYEWPAGDTIPADYEGDGDPVELYLAEAIAQAEGKQYDEPSHTSYVQRSGTQLWYDDAADVQARIAWAVGEGLQGVGFWALGYEGDDPDFWSMVQAETQWEPAETGPTEDTGTTDDPDSPSDTDEGDQGASVVPGEEVAACGCAATGGQVLTAGAALAAALGIRRRRER